MKDNHWSPRVLVFAQGSTVVVKNQDRLAHDGFPDALFDNDTLQIHDYKIIYDNNSPRVFAKTIWFDSESTTQILDIPEWPVPIEYWSSNVPARDIHRAVMFSAPTPYFAVTNERGEFTIRQLPVGKWKFKAWHSDEGYVVDVVVGKEKRKWEKGTFEIEIQPGKNHLGEIVVQPKRQDDK